VIAGVDVTRQPMLLAIGAQKLTVDKVKQMALIEKEGATAQRIAPRPASCLPKYGSLFGPTS
jgi:hypothetical protein